MFDPAIIGDAGRTPLSDSEVRARMEEADYLLNLERSTGLCPHPAALSGKDKERKRKDRSRGDNAVPSSPRSARGVGGKTTEFW